MIISLFKRDITALYIRKSHLSHLWLYLHSLRTAQSLFDRAIVVHHMLHHNIPQRDRQQMSKERQTHREQMKVWKTTLELQHNSRQFLFLCVLLILGITVNVVMAVGFTSGGGPRPCLSNHAYKRTAWPADPALLLPNKRPRQFCSFLRLTPHLWNDNLHLAETPAKWHEVGLGLLFTSTVEAAEAPVPSPTTKTGVCRGPGKRNKAGRRNFPLTQEIGTSCAATQSNHLSLFYWPPSLTHASWLHHYPSPEQVSTNSSTLPTGLTKTGCCYVLQEK